MTKRQVAEEVKQEAGYFDKEYSETTIRHAQQNFIVPEYLIKQVTNPRSKPLAAREYSCHLLGNLKGKMLLDYGCGDGWNAVCFAKAGAKVWAIDISKVGIELTKKKAHANGVENHITAEVRNCYETGYPDNMFDIIYGGGLLHHLDLDLAGEEIRRIMKPDGIAVFMEPIRETKVLDMVKNVVLKLTKLRPSGTTENEAPLTRKKITTLNSYFEITNCRQFNIVSSASVLFKSKFIRSLLVYSDYILIKLLPAFEKLGMAVIIELRSPRK